MLVLKFNLRNQRLSRVNSATVASNSYGYLKTQFNFITDDWQNAEVKVANFSYRGRNYPVLIDENNQCTVPKEVIRAPEFGVSVFGGGITTNIIKIPVENSGIFPDDEDAMSTKYYNEIINQLTAQIDDLSETKADNITYNKDENYIQLTAEGNPIGDKVELGSQSYKKFYSVEEAEQWARSEQISGIVIVIRIGSKWIAHTIEDDYSVVPICDDNGHMVEVNIVDGGDSDGYEQQEAFQIWDGGGAAGI